MKETHFIATVEHYPSLFDIPGIFLKKYPKLFFGVNGNPDTVRPSKLRADASQMEINMITDLQQTLLEKQVWREIVKMNFTDSMIFFIYIYSSIKCISCKNVAFIFHQINKLPTNLPLSHS